MNLCLIGSKREVFNYGVYRRADRRFIYRLVFYCGLIFTL
jgi:hypothetical protein